MTVRIPATQRTETDQTRDSPFLKRLRACVELEADDEQALLRSVTSVRDIPRGGHIIRQGERPRDVHILLRGWAARYEIVADGGRAITAFLLPGDVCDQHVTVLGKMDHSIVTLTNATVASLPNGQLEAVAQAHPRVAQALWWSTLVDEAILRAWLVNIGRRNAFDAVGHLLCELHTRLTKVGLSDNSDFQMPLTQEDIGDSQGLTSVHVNRTLRQLREAGWISQSNGTLIINDLAGLQRATGYDPGYLHNIPVAVARPD